jgi:hypothetical protein
MHNEGKEVRSLTLRLNDVEVICLDGCFTLRTIAGDDDTTLWDKIEVTAESFAELENIIRKLYTQPELDDVLSVVTRIRHIWANWNSNEVSSELDKDSVEGTRGVEYPE